MNGPERKVFPAKFDAVIIRSQFNSRVHLVFDCRARFLDIKDTNARIRKCWSYLYALYYATCRKAFDLICCLLLCGGQSIDVERLYNWRTWFSTKYNSNLELRRTGGKLRLKYNAPDPFSIEAVSIYVDVLNTFNGEKQSRSSSTDVKMDD